MVSQTWSSESDFNAGAYNQTQGSGGTVVLVRSANSSITYQQTFDWSYSLDGTADCTLDAGQGSSFSSALINESGSSGGSDSGSATVTVSSQTDYYTEVEVTGHTEGLGTDSASINPGAGVSVSEFRSDGDYGETQIVTLPAPYYASGTLTSDVRNWSSPVGYDTVEVDATESGQSISITIYNEDGDSVTVGPGTTDISNLNPSSSVSFEADLSTSNGDASPQLNSITINATQQPAAPENLSLTYLTDDDIEFSFTEDTSAGTVDYFEVEMLRDNGSWMSPAGGSSQPSTDGTFTYTPSSDSPYGQQIGLDSSFEFRARAVNSAGASSWVNSGTVYTTPIQPHAPSIARPGGTTVEHNWSVESDVENGTEIQYREDTGSGYGAWTTLTTTGSGATGYTETGISTDVRRQYRYRHTGPNTDSGWVYADYGNESGVYFEDGFESGDLSNWSGQDLSDSQSGVVQSPDSAIATDTGVSGPDEGSYLLQLAAGNWVEDSLGDLSNESQVHVRVRMAVGSLDSNSAEVNIWWTPDGGSNWTEIGETLNWSYNRQGWVTVHGLIPQAQLGTDCIFSLQGYPSGDSDDYALFDEAVVGDILHEYTAPAVPSSASANTSVEEEISVSWSDNATFETGYEFDHRRSSDGAYTTETLSANTETEVDSGLFDGEEYEYRIRAILQQYRNGAASQTFNSGYTTALTATTILPAPTLLSSPAKSATSIDADWTANHNYGDTRVEYKTSDSATWQVFSTVSQNTETETITGLKNGEEYDIQVVAETEHTETEVQ